MGWGEIQVLFLKLKTLEISWDRGWNTQYVLPVGRGCLPSWRVVLGPNSWGIDCKERGDGVPFSHNQREL